jgi:hypothetical protein
MNKFFFFSGGGVHLLSNLPNLHNSPNPIRVFKLRAIRLTEYLARMDEIRNKYKILIEKHEGKRPLWRPRRRWRTLKRIIRKTGSGRLDWIQQAQETGSICALCEHGNEPSGYIKGKEFVDLISYKKLIRNDSALCS